MNPIEEPIAFSRRNFLAGAAAGLFGLAGAAALGGCTPSGTTEDAPLADTGEAALKEPTDTREADIVIVGSGAAGCFAAYEAAKAGVGKVLVVTKSGNATDSNFNEITGTSSVETKLLKEAGETFTVDQMYEHMMNYAHWTVNARLLRQCVSLLPSNIDIFDEMGVETMVLGDRYNFGFLNVHGFTGKNKGENFEAGLTALGVEFLYDAPVTHILTEDGKAVGVQCECGRDVINVNAKAVLVCTGGYLANEEKVREEYGGTFVVNMGSLKNTGDGERIVLEAGGVPERIRGMGMNDIYGMNAKSTISVFEANPFMQLAFYGGLLTDPKGNRFMNEYMLAQEPMNGGGEATLHEKCYYAIFSENTVNAMKDSPYYQNIGSPAVWTSAATMFNAPLADFDANLAKAQEEGWCFKAGSIEELAELTGLADLPQTVKDYDECVAAGKDSLFLKTPEFLQPIEDDSAAYYAFEYNPSAFNTFGGPRTDEQCRVLNVDSDPIPGLYMAGVENGSLFCSPYYAVGGSCSGLSIASGRVAARAMAEYVQQA
ncbi:FAD-binding protein [uncultured Adlercreutzia sp.]|uniref:FAD-dependent oxidoreductase n=1 Tax=uncultured Adlercreutzia sp. TaxID=875803 RepID=UPI0026F4015C|nr:FAD-binding protein [uncultured Adlercreutzia sp.]